MGGQDDADHMGTCIEPLECVIDLERFEQYRCRIAVLEAQREPPDMMIPWEQLKAELDRSWDPSSDL